MARGPGLARARVQPFRDRPRAKQQCTGKSARGEGSSCGRQPPCAAPAAHDLPCGAEACGTRHPSNRCARIARHARSCRAAPHLQRARGVVEHHVVWPRAQVLLRVDPLHRAKAAHKVNVHDAVHAEVDPVAADPALLALGRVLGKEDVARRALRTQGGESARDATPHVHLSAHFAVTLGTRSRGSAQRSALLPALLLRRRAWVRDQTSSLWDRRGVRAPALPIAHVRAPHLHVCGQLVNVAEDGDARVGQARPPGHLHHQRRAGLLQHVPAAPNPPRAHKTSNASDDPSERLAQGDL